ncbi:N-formylglutamate amidohydrolase [Orrella dioscoreae]|uniref:N-formylglutamate deformylase n=2 Tax=root TaxID=1 RepID=A0A1C3JZ58_9BURK|nr:N-formylglutamate amidohydrolase [Orrella dioscoreae]SBT24445.1 N-formylglutamate deformylase [Orrella dioscoreae]SOE52249.1 N-formylglutamate deformylase [Orrella dioscoreae]
MTERNPAYTLRGPEAAPIALVCDSPHSGVDYPADFGHAVDRQVLRAAEDTHVEALWQDVPAVGGTLLAAHFPRSYVDANRSEDDIDAALLAEPWPQPLSPSEKTRLGYGLIWRRVNAATPIYDRLLSLDEVQGRIARCYRPYHAALANAIEDTAARFGGVWHLNLHSMPNNAYERLQIQSAHPLADFVLGDRDGTTCEPAFVDLIERELKACGYSVARNDPYKGVQLIAKIGQPARKRNSLQIEIRRPVYMDEASRERSADFATVQRDLSGLLGKIAAYLREQAPVPASKA